MVFRFYLLIACFFFAAGALCAAETELEQVDALEKEKAYGKAGEIWERLVEKEPQNAYYLYRLGRVYALTGRYEEAEKLLNRSLEINPTNADAQLSLAYLYLWTKREEKAKSLFSQILEDYPDYEDAKKGLVSVEESERAEFKRLENESEEKAAESFEEEKEYGEAGKIWERLVEKSPQNAYYLYRLGRVYALTGRYEEAEKLLNRSLEINPTNADAQLSLAYLYLWTKREEKAKSLFSQILEDYPDYEDAKKGLVSVEESERAEFKRLENEIVEGQKKIALFFPEAIRESEEKAAKSFEEEKEYEDAGEIWERLVDKDPQNAYYLYRLGRVYALVERYQEAEVLLTRSLEINPTNADTQLSLANLYFWTGREEKAKELFHDILKEYPEYEDAKKGLEKIEESIREKEKEAEKKEEKEEIKEPEFAHWQKARMKVAEILEKRKCYNEAIAIWCELLKTAGPSPTVVCLQEPPQSTLEHTCLQTGILCCQQQDIDKEWANVIQQQKVFAFRIGQLFSWKGEWKRAKAYLNYALSLDPQYGQAWLRLGYVALFSGRLSRARQIFWRLVCKDLSKPDTDALEGYARASQALIDNREARRAYCWRFREAKPTYQLFKQLSSVLLWTDPWLKGASLYAQERETDLITKVRSAQRNTFFGSLAYYCPINDQSRFFVSGYGGTEREINLVAGRDNFSVLEWKYGIGYDRLINPWLSLRTWCDVKAGRDMGEPIFPLGLRRRVEPGGVLIYNRQSCTASISAVRDSFIVKEFANFVSTFLRRETYTGQIEHGFFNNWIYTGLLGFYAYYHDRPLNRQWEGQGWVTAGYPRYEPYLFIHYKGRVGGYKFTETDYYSYSRQWEHFAKIYLLKETILNTEIETGYHRSWQWSRDLNQPINTAVFVEKLFRITNKAYLELRHLYRPNLHLMFRTEYYIDTTEYTAWLTRGEIKLVF